MNKILSIIIPAYNVAPYLRRGCESIIFDDEELLDKLDVIIVNDGSNDNTSVIAHDFESRFPKVFKVIDKTNGNYGSCINVGLSVAVGNFVRIQDGDDYFDTEGLKKLVKFLDQVEPDVDLVLCDYNTVNQEGIRAITKDYTFLEDCAFVLDSSLYGQRRIDMLMTTYRRDIFARFEYHQTEGMSYTDGEWITYPMAFVRKARYIPVVVGLYLIGRNGQTMNLETYAKNFSQVVDIAKGIVACHSKILENPRAVSRLYFSHLVAYMINMVFYSAIIGISNDIRPKVDLRALDEYIKTTDIELYNKLDDFRVLTRFFRLRLIHAYRRFYSINDPMIILYRTFISIYGAIARLLARAR